jgi:hypothetical protein
MSDNIEINTNDTDLESPVEDGQVEESNEVLETPEEEDFELFDYTQFSDNKVKLQVNGEEIVVPLSEALAGYQRQADYTRKTQELSEQKKQIQFAAAIQESLDNDPAGTLQMLQQAYGLDTNQNLGLDDEWLDPAEQRVQDLEARLMAFEQQRAMDDLQKTLDSLQVKYGDDFSPDEVVAKALAQGSTDLEAIFKQIAFDKVYAEAKAGKKKVVEETTRTQAKREAAIVSGGTSAKGTAPIKPDQPKSVFEAYEAAKRTLGI